MAPKRITPTAGNSPWLNGWPYRVFAEGKVKVGTAKIGAFKAWSFSLFSYANVDYENENHREQCILQEMARRGIGPGPGKQSLSCLQLLRSCCVWRKPISLRMVASCAQHRCGFCSYG
jgi:hypothetical protein